MEARKRPGELLLAAGAWESNGRIKIPEHVVMAAIGAAPSRILLTTGWAVDNAAGRSKYSLGPLGRPFHAGLEDGERRPSRSKTCSALPGYAMAWRQIGLLHVDGECIRRSGSGPLFARFCGQDSRLGQAECVYGRRRADNGGPSIALPARGRGETGCGEKPFLILYAESDLAAPVQRGFGREAPILRGKGASGDLSSFANTGAGDR